MTPTEFKGFLEAMRALGVPSNQVHHLIGVTRDTVYRWQRDGMSVAHDANIQRVLKEQKEQSNENQ